MNKFFTALLISLLLLLSSVLVGQHQYEIPDGYILTEGSNKYHFDGKQVNYEQLSVLFNDSPALYALSKQAIINKKKASAAGVVAAIGLVGGLVGSSLCSEFGCFLPALVGLISIPVGIAAANFKGNPIVT